MCQAQRIFSRLAGSMLYENERLDPKILREHDPLTRIWLDTDVEGYANYHRLDAISINNIIKITIPISAFFWSMNSRLLKLIYYGGCTKLQSPDKTRTRPANTQSPVIFITNEVVLSLITVRIMRLCIDTYLIGPMRHQQVAMNFRHYVSLWCVMLVQFDTNTTRCCSTAHWMPKGTKQASKQADCDRWRSTAMQCITPSMGHCRKQTRDKLAARSLGKASSCVRYFAISDVDDWSGTLRLGLFVYCFTWRHRTHSIHSLTVHLKLNNARSLFGDNVFDDNHFGKIRFNITGDKVSHFGKNIFNLTTNANFRNWVFGLSYDRESTTAQRVKS